jgi:hypothetical protein
MSQHAYPTSALAGDYVRAAAGLALVGAPLTAVPLNGAVAGALGIGVALFAGFGLRTLYRHVRPIDLSSEALSVGGPFAVRLPWSELSSVRLAYYATRRDRRDGWMQLRLGAGRRHVTLDSRIEGFEAIARHAALAARRRSLPISAATSTNFAALGIDLEMEDAA